MFYVTIIFRPTVFFYISYIYLGNIFNMYIKYSVWKMVNSVSNHPWLIYKIFRFDGVIENFVLYNHVLQYFCF